MELHPQVHDRLVRASGFTPLIFGVPFKQALVGRVDGDSGIPIVLDGFPIRISPNEPIQKRRLGWKKYVEKDGNNRINQVVKANGPWYNKVVKAQTMPRENM